MTGLAAGVASGLPVLEQAGHPGGICASYHRDGYRFERGGGHWIFGADPVVTRFFEECCELRTYRRRSAALFLGGCEETRDLRGRFVPYPLQYNLFALPRPIREQGLAEILSGGSDGASTMAEWLKQRFGPTLYRLFFEPFHERYTAGIFRECAPEDAYKSPVDRRRALHGTGQGSEEAGYNETFSYPTRGLDAAAQCLAQRCDIRYGSAVVQIDVEGRCLVVEGSGKRPYQTLVSTAPLNRTVEIAGLSERVGPCDPYTSVLVLNLGVTLPDTPLARNGWQWLYIPDSRSGFHRVGYYSNVDRTFLPESCRNDPARGALYVERAFAFGMRLSPDAENALIAEMIEEIQNAGLVDKVEIADPTWIPIAYTWRWPGSNWVARTIAACREYGIEPAGRYGRWTFQGISASLKEGFLLGNSLRQARPGALAPHRRRFQ